MKNRLYCKILAMGIIILFIGVSFPYGFAVDINHSIRVNQSEECWECEKSESSICEVLYQIFYYFHNCCNDIIILFEKYSNYPILSRIISGIGTTILLTYATMGLIGALFRCEWADIYDPPY